MTRTFQAIQNSGSSDKIVGKSMFVRIWMERVHRHATISLSSLASHFDSSHAGSSTVATAGR